MIRFNMSKIAINQFAILNDNCQGKEITLSTELKFQYSEETRQISCEVGYRFSTEEELFLILKSQCDFVIHPDDWIKFERVDGIAIPKSVMELLAVHTIGTSRGILFCKTEGTPFANLMIPPINVAGMMKDEEEIVSGRQ